MNKIIIEVEPALEQKLQDAARIKGMRVEDYIVTLLHRYALTLHTMEVEAMEKGYADCGALNLEWANLK